MATSVIDRLLIQIEANAAQLQAELAKGGQSVKAFGKQTEAVAKSSDGIGQRYNQAAVQIASAAENMARAGKVGGEGLKQIIVQGSNMAFLFGPQGALVGAVGIASLAIIEIFRKAREETKKLADETKKELDALQNTGDVIGLTERAKVLFEGTPSGGFKDGLKSLRQEFAALKTEIERSPLAKLSQDAQLNDPLGTIDAKTKERFESVKSTLGKLEAEFTDIRRRIQEPGPSATNERDPIRTKVISLQDVATAQRAASQAIRDLTQGFGDLFAKALRGDVALSEFDRTVRELGDGFRDKLQKPTKEQSTAFAQLDARAKDVRRTLSGITAAKAAAEFEALRASLTPTVLDDFRLKLAKLIETLRDKNFSEDQISDIVSLEQALGTVAVGLETLQTRIERIKEGAISSFDAQIQLVGVLQEAQAKLAELETIETLAGSSEQSAIVIAGLRKQIQQLREEIERLGGTRASTFDPKGAEQLAIALSNAVDFAFGLSSALLGADDTITRMIGGIGQVASGFVKVAALAAEAGGTGALFSSGAGIASALPGVGAIVGGIASLLSVLGQEDPATRALREALDRNARRLEELTSSVGELVSISIGGADAAAVRDLAITKVEQTGIDPLSGEAVFGDVRKSSAELLADLRDVGVSLKELQQVASDFGVSFANANFPTADEIRSLQLLISANGLKKLTDTLVGQLNLLDLQVRIDPQAFAGIDGIIKRIAVLTGDKGVPALATALAGIDLTSADGPAQAIERLKQLLADFTAGNLDLSLLGGLNPDDFVEAIAALIESITKATPALQTPADRFSQAMEAFGVAVEFGTLTAQGKLDKARALFADLFPDLAASVDTSSAEAFKTSIQSIIDGFAADGTLSEAEQAQIAILKQLAGAFDDASESGEQIADAFSVLEDRFVIFGTKAADQISAILDEVTSSDSIGKNAGFALLEGLTEGLDLATEEGRAELQKRAQAIFEALSADGVTADEQAVIDILKRVLGLTKDVASEAADAASDAADAIARLAQEREKARQAILDGAEVDIKLNDVTDPVEQLGIRIRALSTAFPELGAVLGEFDTSTQEGRDALEAWIREIAGSPEALESLAAAMGVTVDELLSALVGLEEGADAATTKVATLAEKLGAAFDAADFESELEGITDPLEKLRRSAAKVSDVMPELAAIFKQFDLSTAQGRAGAEAALIALGKSTTDADVQRAVLKLLAQIRSVPVVGPSALQGTGGGLSSAAATSANVAAATSITEVTANRLVDLFGRNVVATEGILAALTGSLARTLAVPAPVTPPVLPSMVTGAFGQSASGAGSGVALSVPITLQFNGNVTTASEDELARLVQQRIYELFQGALATELQVAVRRAGLARSN